MKACVRLFSVCLALGATVSAQPTVRVGLFTLSPQSEITILRGKNETIQLRTCQHCAAIAISDSLGLRAVGNTVVHNGISSRKILLSGELILATHEMRLVMPYPLQITAHNGKLTPVVTIPIERYVERVVASEAGSVDSTESLKALAVVVRSFALHVRHGHANYDLCDSTHCQLLRWSETGQGTVRGEAAHEATLATAGETLWFHGQSAAAWFHQNSGGHTASPAEVWSADMRPMPWLAGQVDRHGIPVEWTSHLSMDELTRALAQAGLAKPGWTSLTVTTRGESGRATRLRADATEFSAEDFRIAVGRALGWNRIPSTWFEISRQGNGYFFHGRGRGHGVGLSQTGAAAMAAAGSSYQQILAQYFPGAIAADEASGASWQSFTGQGFLLETLDPADRAYMPQLSEALQEAEQRSTLHATGIAIRSFRSTEAFREATLAPGWVAGFTEGHWIGVQPLNVLAQRKILGKVMRHEMLHALVESVATDKTPLWLREGLVEVWSTNGNAFQGLEKIDPERVEYMLAHAQSEAESAKAHHEAGILTARLLQHFGQAQVLDWLRHGLPANVESTLH